MKTLILLSMVGLSTFWILGAAEQGAHRYVNGLICSHEAAQGDIQCHTGLVSVYDATR